MPSDPTPELTKLEVETLLHAALAVADDIRSEGGSVMGWTAAETRAYWRAVEKLSGKGARRA